LRIVIRGRSAHAAFPQEGVDPVPAACAMVQAFETIITRNKRPIDAALVSITMLHAGEANNVTPGACEMQGTVRTFDIEVLDLIERRMRQIAEATCEAFEASCEFEFKRIYPPTVNHPQETDFAGRTLTAFAGAENVLELDPTTRRVMPTYLAFLRRCQPKSVLQ
jgi:metal-dependent amidase/aminoacylase/carboxypeptidase family protein